MSAASLTSAARRQPAARVRAIPVQVVARTHVTRDAVTLLLATPGTQRAPSGYLPGQFITLEFPTERASLYRSYSLCGVGRADMPWEITIKRHGAGRISRYLHEHARPGMLLRASLPQGNFTLSAPIRPEVPLIFVAGGTGITPLYAISRALAGLAPRQRPQVWLHYAYRSRESAIYAREIEALDPAHSWLHTHHYASAAGQRLRADQPLAALGPAAARAEQAEWYICGPAALRDAVIAEAQRQGVAAARIHVETFASPAAPERSSAPATGATARVRLANSGAVLAARPGETLLETLERHGYQPEFNCRAGACGTCALRLVAGQVRGGDGGGLTAAERQAGMVLACVAHPLGEVTLATAGSPVVARPAGHAPARTGTAGRPSKTPLRTGLL
ncbi:MAG TPA: 2Fe-2S iron-sulfur cluster-binding protein, partial [Ktedonobacterales bacterium]|nr:2Fe-2S iron-sulfur cluster-binding protein [Ktedonobacterales bacterium]